MRNAVDPVPGERPVGVPHDVYIETIPKGMEHKSNSGWK